MNRFVSALLLIVALLLAACGGCTPHTPPAEVPTFGKDDVGFVLILNVDVSGSFLEALEAKGWAFVSKLLQQFFRDRDTESDQIIISQLSGSRGQGPVWKGSPRAFRKKFGNGGAFQNYLAKFSPNGSRIHDSITESIGYAMQHAGGKTRLLLVTLSDFEDNASAPGSEDRLVEALRRFGAANGRVAFFWLPSSMAQVWEGHLRQLFPSDHFVVVPDIVDSVKLPNLE